MCVATGFDSAYRLKFISVVLIIVSTFNFPQRGSGGTRNNTVVFSGNDSDGPGKAAEFLIAQTKQKFLGKANKKTSKKAKKAAAAAAAAASAATETVKNEEEEEKPAVNNSLTSGAEVNGVGGKPSKQQGANSVKPHSITDTEDQIMVSTSTAESEEEEDERPLAAAMSKKQSPSKTAASIKYPT